MNDTMSVLLATTLLALGGLGIYMYKSEEQPKGGRKRNNHKVKEDKPFSFFGETEEAEDSQDMDLDDDGTLSDVSEMSEEEEPRKKRNNKTQRTRKQVGSKRRY